MPWTESDYPPSFNKLSPEKRKKAIEIANALLARGYKDGSAIAMALKRVGR